MVDYFVDLSLGSNGTGTSSSPWNQVTAAELTSVSGGDTIWFKRFDPGTNIDLISWKAGTSNENRISYVGWPISGDHNYDSRPVDLRASWDPAAASHVYQRYNTAGGYAAVPDYVNVHRFLLYHAQNSNTVYGVYMSGKQNVTFTKCYMTNAFCQYDGVGGSVVTDNCNNIEFLNCFLASDGSNGSVGSSAFKFNNTTNVTVSGCDLYFGQNNNSAVNIGYFDADVSRVNTGTASFINCNWYFRHYVAAGSNAGDYWPGVVYFTDATVTISGGTMNMNNGNDNTTYPMSAYPVLFAFRSNNTNLYIKDITVAISQRRHGFLMLQGSTAKTILLENISYTVTSRPQTVFLDLRNNNCNITLRNITGSIYEGSKDYLNVGYFISFYYWWSVMANTGNTFTFDNVQENLGYVLDDTRDTVPYSVSEINNNTNPILKHNILYVTRCSSIYMNNSTFKGFKLVNQGDNTGNYIRGGLLNTFKMTFENCSILDIPVQITTSMSNKVITATIYNCTGNGTATFLNDSATGYSLTLKAIRNKAFTSLGTADLDGIEVYSNLNNFDSGTSLYSSYDIAYQTSTVYRNSGAPYSVQIIKKSITGIKSNFPIIGDDNIWVYLPAAGTFRLTAYATYTCASGTLSSSDLKMGVDIYTSYSELVLNSTLSADVASTWNGISGNNIQLVTEVTVTDAQYCPIRLYIYTKLTNQIIYLDPKINVLDIS